MFEFSDTYLEENGTAMILVFPSFQAKLDFENYLALDIAHNGIIGAAVTNKRASYILKAVKTKTSAYTASIIVVANLETLWESTSYTNTTYASALADAAKKLIYFNKRSVNNLLVRLDNNVPGPLLV